MEFFVKNMTRTEKDIAFFPGIVYNVCDKQLSVFLYQTRRLLF